MNHLELFSGIGGFRRAFDLIQIDFKLPVHHVAFSEIDEKAKQTYMSIYPDASNELDMGDIVSFNNTRIEELTHLDIDILTGGFPCQSFSMMGEKLGFNDQRGQLFFQIYKILKYKLESEHPIPFVLLENVKNLKTHDNGRTLQAIISHLESLGYHVYYDVFNTADYKLAQRRNRVLIFATLKDIQGLNFSSEIISALFNQQDFNKLHVERQENILSVLDKNVSSKYYLSERIKPTILSDGTGGYIAKSEINQLIARPLTASMHKMHRACQDNYYSDGFMQAKNPVDYLTHIFTKEELCQQKIRKLTPEEAFNLQGFPKQFATHAREAGIADGSLYKQAGNAISVNVIYAVLYYLFVNQHLL